MTVQPIPMTCPNLRHRSSTAAVDVGSAHLDAVHAGSDTRAAPNPLPANATHCAFAIVGRRRNRRDQRFPEPLTAACALVDELSSLRNRRRARDADGLRVRTADGRMRIMSLISGSQPVEPCP